MNNQHLVMTDPKIQSKEVAKPIKNRRRAPIQVTLGNAYIKATYNNTMITFTDQRGDVLTTISAGHAGFSGPKKSTPYAAGIIVRRAVEKVREYGLKEIHVFVKGIGSGREAAIRAIHANGINVLSVKDTTPLPHNGPRPKKPRRV